MEVISCPIENHSDAIRKIASIVLEGKTSGTWVQANGSHIYIEGTSTQLVTLLSLPPKPINKEVAFSWLLTTIYILFGASAVVGFFATSYGMVSGNPPEMFGQSIGLGCVLTILYSVIAVAAFSYKFTKSRQNKEIYEKELNNWDRIRVKWERLYYCYKHHIVFDPESSDELCLPTDLIAFLSK